MWIRILKKEQTKTFNTFLLIWIYVYIDNLYTFFSKCQLKIYLLTILFCELIFECKIFLFYTFFSSVYRD